MIKHAVVNAMYLAPTVVGAFGHQGGITLDTNGFRHGVFFTPIVGDRLDTPSQSGELRNSPIVVVPVVEDGGKADQNQRRPDATKGKRDKSPDRATLFGLRFDLGSTHGPSVGRSFGGGGTRIFLRRIDD
ncbi:hypothetical protein [Rosistilla oblonga]|uniref:hypothetical protein n=1 Tax=Rosistilla oblonga TaxID=2527990 RepID=UPI003A9797D1